MAPEVCEEVVGGEARCFAPLLLRGRVFDAADLASGIEGAVVAARDVNGAIVSHGTTRSGVDGAYELRVPTARSEEGEPSELSLTLRADAAGFATFPGGLRVAVPVDTSVTAGDAGYVVENASTDIALDALANAAALGTLHGHVRAEDAVGTLVVAGASSGLASRDGSFSVFNVPPGEVEVRGFKLGLQLAPTTVSVQAGALVDDVELTSLDVPLGRVSGDVSFVNAGARETSVVLVVESTFHETLVRGEVPAGLRLPTVTGPFAFEQVPNGRYVVLAAFENDDLVRDPDMAIGGTAIQRVGVDSADVSVPSFKITGALAVVSPGATAPEPVTAAPTFTWQDDSSEDGYEVRVFDTFGKEVWYDPEVARVTGSSDVTHDYAGPALEPGYYQFRAVSWRSSDGGRTYISATEDLKGVFIVP